MGPCIILKCQDKNFFFAKLEKMMRIKFNRSRGNNWLQNKGGMNSITSENAKNKFEEDKVVALFQLQFPLFGNAKVFLQCNSFPKHEKMHKRKT